MKEKEMKKAYQLHLMQNWRNQTIKSTLLLLIAITLFIISTYDDFWSTLGISIIRLIGWGLSFFMFLLAVFSKSIRQKSLRIIGTGYIFSMLMLVTVESHLRELFYPAIQHSSYEVSMAILIGILLFANPLRDILPKVILVTSLLNLLFLYRHYSLDGLPIILPYIVFLAIAYFLSRQINKTQYENFMANEKLIASNSKLEKLLHLQKIAQKETEEANSKDSLTQTLSREFGLKYLQNATLKARKLDKPLTICFVDLDNLKMINDRYGHNIGDQYIINVIKLLVTNLPSCPIIRLGGDEFLIIFENRHKTDVDVMLLEITRKLKAYNAKSQLTYQLQFSFGIAEYNEKKYIHIDKFIDDADRLMYIQKSSKKTKQRSMKREEKYY